MYEKKILLISPDFPPPFVGGSLVWIHNLISNSSKHFEVLTAQNIQYDFPKNINIIHSKYIINSNNPKRTDLLKNYFFIFFWCLINFRKKKYEVIISNPGLVGNCIIFFLGKVFKKKVIGTVYAEELTTAIYGSGLKNKIKVFLIKSFYKYADSFISVCEFSKKIIRKLKLNQEITVLPPSGYLKIQSKIFNKPNSILSVGRLIKRKGFDKLILAANEVKQKNINIKLDIVGNGPEINLLNSLIENLGASKFIEIHDNIDNDQLAKFYLNADLFILANRMLENGDTEGCPVVFIEAMSYMLPLIGGVGGGVDTAIKDGENGFIIDTSEVNSSSDKIGLILNDLSLIQSMSSCSKKKLIKDHNNDIISSKFNNLL